MPITIQGSQRNLTLTAAGSKEAGPDSPFYHPRSTNSRNLPAPAGTAIQRSVGAMKMLSTSATAQGAIWDRRHQIKFLQHPEHYWLPNNCLFVCMNAQESLLHGLCASILSALRLSRDKAHTCIQSWLWLPNTKVSDYVLKNIFSGNWAVNGCEVFALTSSPPLKAWH